jgi:hypothetical protein
VKHPAPRGGGRARPRQTDTLEWSLVLLGVALTAGCSPPADTSSGAGPVFRVPAQDVGARCLDVGASRACWAPSCPGGVCVLPRTVPRAPAPRAGWRCLGAGAARTCQDRGRGVGAFVCDGGECRQRHPRLPDDGEWDCIDQDGAAVCMGGVPAAGVPAAPVDPGWRCGPRAGHPDERVCVDHSPDRPPLPGVWSCRYEHDPREVRLCTREAHTRDLGGSCEGGCPEGARCVQDRCVPAFPEPSCWFDADCGERQRCRWGLCAPSS